MPHRHIGVKTLGDRVADEGDALLLQQLDQSLLLGHQGVDPLGLAVEEVGDGMLVLGRGDVETFIEIGADVEILNAGGLLDGLGIDACRVQVGMDVAQIP